MHAIARQHFNCSCTNQVAGIVHCYALNHCVPEHNTTMYCSCSCDNQHVWKHLVAMQHWECHGKYCCDMLQAPTRESWSDESLSRAVTNNVNHYILPPFLRSIVLNAHRTYQTDICNSYAQIESITKHDAHSALCGPCTGPSYCCQGRLCLSKLSAGTLKVAGG